ncbi:TMV resistance protein N isoform B [Glycine soja]|uniref:ADP-ribosyl cyclase/cyclic ADP-ribose hydrolase n=1 Tax=Glycine soja TaxID=3848 RepID=A0A445KEF3_GLYSO|nr:TMV resistance protein N isoform B [Glycine soja]
MAFTSNDVIQCTSSSSFEYDVFVSFRGEDTRNSFTGFLLQALKKEGIEAFKDDKDIRKGESIAPELIRAIEGSHVFLVVFSKGYASSTWCLRELAHIWNCIQTSPRHLLPIFYDVDPSQVRKQSGDYQKAFAQHQQSFRFQEKEINTWREVLERVANLSGWDIRYKQQHAVIEEIVQQIKNILGSKFSTLPYDNLVGMESHFAKLSKLICLGPANDVRVVGITGMGGIGKSTLGRALYERISHQFNSLCYIDDVSKLYQGYGTLGVQKQLLSQSLNERNLEICNVSDGTLLAWKRLSNAKALIVLDNVDQDKQLDMFTGGRVDLLRKCLGRGSIVIIISRDKQILKAHGVDVIYQVKPLNDEDAARLFCRKAFKSNYIVSDFEKMTGDALLHCQGHPLAIEVLGSSLFDKDVSHWRSALASLRAVILLEFVNSSKDLTFSSSFAMFKPAENVEAIVVQMNHHHGTTMGVDGLSTMSHLKLLQLESSIPDSKRKFSGMLVNLSNELGYLKWIFYPFKCLPPSFEPDKLVELILRHSNSKKLWKGRKPLPNLRHLDLSHSKNLIKMPYIGDSLYLETLNLQGCIQLKEIGLSIVLSRRLSYLDLKDSKCLINLPRFGEDLILQILVLEGCQKLRHIDSSIGLLKKLRRLDLKNCKNLVSLPNSILGLNSLECLNLSGCSKLYNIQLLYELRDAEHLKKIDIDGAPIHFQSTSSYSRQHKKSVGCLMPSSPIFPCMCELDLSFCNLVQIPDAIGIICCLEKLDLSGNNFVTLPNLKKLSKLFSLKLQHCKKLKSLPELPSRIDLPTDAFDCFRLMIPSYFKNEKIGLYIFNCPELVDRDRCTDMALSWMILISQVQFKLPFNRRIQSVTTGSEIPRWFNNQHEGNCVSLDASPVMHDDNWIGVAFCLMFVVPHETLSAMGFSDSDCPPWHSFGDIPVDFYGDLDLELVLDKSDHMWLFFVSRTQFSRQFSLKLKYLGRLVLKCDKGMGWSESYAEVKKYGYRWVYKEDKEEPSNPLARKRKFEEIEENEGKRKKGIISAEGRKDDATSSQEKTIKLLQNEFENLSL